MRLLFLTLFLISTLNAEEQWLKDPDKAFKLSKETSKPLLIDFYAEWCGPCKMMDKTTLQDSGVNKLLSRFILLKVDGDKFPDQVSKFSVTGYPTFIILNMHSEKIAIISGFQDAENFSEWIISNMEQAQSKTSMAELDDKDMKFLEMIKENNNRKAAFEAIVDRMFKNEFKKKKLFIELDKLTTKDLSSCYEFLNHEALSCRLVASMIYSNQFKEKFTFDPWQSKPERLKQLEKVRELIK